jgi:adenosylcobyric acid synthase
LPAEGLVLMGTGASSGKTMVARALARMAVDRGIPVQPYKAVSIVDKPVAVGERVVDLTLRLLALAARSSEEEALGHCSFTAEPVEGGARLRATGPGPGPLTVPFLGEDQLDWESLDGDRYRDLVAAVRADVERLSRAGPVLVEGSASPTDAPRDLANVDTWRQARFPVVLIAGALRGGGTAAIVGTLELLPDDVRRAVVGYVINGIRTPARGEEWAHQVTAHTGLPCLGLIRQLPAYTYLRDRTSPDAMASWEEETAFLAAELQGLWEPTGGALEPSPLV